MQVRLCPLSQFQQTFSKIVPLHLQQIYVALTCRSRSYVALSVSICADTAWRELQGRTKEQNRKTPCTNGGLVAARNLRRILKGGNTGKAGSDVRDQQNDGWVQNADFSGCFKTHARNRIRSKTGRE